MKLTSADCGGCEKVLLSITSEQTQSVRTRLRISCMMLSPWSSTSTLSVINQPCSRMHNMLLEGWGPTGPVTLAMPFDESLTRSSAATFRSIACACALIDLLGRPQ
jgi:hypothetical protein